MLPPKTLNLRIGDRLRSVLEAKALSSGLVSPMPAILWGKWDDEGEEHYSIGFYDRDNLPISDPVRIVEAGGLQFLILQDWICEAVHGKELDVVDGKLTLVGQGY